MLYVQVSLDYLVVGPPDSGPDILGLPDPQRLELDLDQSPLIILVLEHYRLICG